MSLFARQSSAELSFIIRWTFQTPLSSTSVWPTAQCPYNWITCCRTSKSQQADVSACH